ncbi:MAG: InlB B-repeat-containing protein [Clostridia bacterium]|nr:InlB B-repeat-containing protein [Clostridia bacterium]
MIRIDDREIRARLAKAVSYYDPIDKTDKTKEECLVVDSTATIWENDWYVVTGFVRIGSRVQVSGNVNLILTNGANLIVPKGIEVPFEANFTVWGQIEGYTTEYSKEDFNKAGELHTFEFVDNDMVVPDAENAGIGAELTGNIIVNGGKINAQGGQYAPGIGISSPYYINTTGITVNNGYIWAMGGDKSAGIGGGYGGTCPPLEINDGVVIAWGGGDAAAIGGGYFGYYYPITIRGGEVYAYGSPWTAGIGMGCTDGDYTGIFASDVGGGLIDIQGGKVVANCSGHDNNHPDCGALVNSEHRIAEYGFNFHGGVHVYPEAKVTYVKDYILDVTSHPELHIVYRGTAAQFTEDELAERAGIMMSSDWVFIEPCDHPGATYTAVTLLPQSGHVMHCTACDLPETVEPHVYDSTGKCTLCGYQAQLVTVTFDADGGSAVAAQSVPVGEKAAKPADPEKEDFSFTGWYLVTDGNLAETPFDFETTPITANITLRAVWEPVAYPIIVVAHSLSLNGDIGVNFYVDIPDATDAAYAEFTLDGKTVQAPINLNKYRDQDGVRLYKFTCNVAAAQIDTEISGVIINGEARSKAFTYSVQTYLTEAQQTMADNAEFMALAGSLATYGYYSNELFGFDPDFQQHALFDDSGFAGVTAASLADDEAQINDTTDGVTYVGSSLVLRTETAIKHYFTLPAGTTLDDFNFLLGEGDTAVALTPIAAGNFYYVEIPNIASGNLGKAYTVTVFDGDNNAVNTWSYSALSYVYKVLTKAEANDPTVSAELANVSKALTLYYQAADAYFHRETV